MTDNIFAQLVRGSEELDRMKREFRLVVTMIFNFVYADNPKSFTNYHFYSGDVEWLVKKHLDNTVLFVECWVAPVSLTAIYRDKNRRYCAFTSEGHPSDIAREDIRRIHRNMKVLIDGMFEKFPSLKQELRAFLEVAQ